MAASMTNVTKTKLATLNNSNCPHETKLDTLNPWATENRMAASMVGYAQMAGFAVAFFGQAIFAALRYAEVSKETCLYGKRGLLTFAYLRYVSVCRPLLP